MCLWDDKGPAKIHQALKEDILDFIKQAQAVRRPAFTEMYPCFYTANRVCLSNHPDHKLWFLLNVCQLDSLGSNRARLVLLTVF